LRESQFVSIKKVALCRARLVLYQNCEVIIICINLYIFKSNLFLVVIFVSKATDAALTKRERQARLIDSSNVSVLPSGETAENDET